MSILFYYTGTRTNGSCEIDTEINNRTSTDVSESDLILEKGLQSVINAQNGKIEQKYHHTCWWR